MTIRNGARPTNCFPAGRVAHVVQRCGLAITGALYGLFIVAHLANANVDVFHSIGLVFAMIRFGIIGFHLGNDIAPLSREAGIGVTSKADVIEAYNAAGAFLATAATLVSVYVAVFDEVLPVVWVVIVTLCWLFSVTMQIIVRLRVQNDVWGRRKTQGIAITRMVGRRRRRINLLEVWHPEWRGECGASSKRGDLTSAQKNSKKEAGNVKNRWWMSLRQRSVFSPG